MKYLISAIFAVVATVCTADAKTLVAYYSHTGTTAALAQIIADLTGGTPYQIETADASWYPDEYDEMTDQASRELDNGTLPPIAQMPDIAEYDTVFIGTPCWWARAATPVQTFLHDADLAGKKVIPFNTHLGSGKCGHNDIISKTPKSRHLDGYVVRGDADAADVQRWLADIGIIKQ